MNRRFKVRVGEQRIPSVFVDANEDPAKVLSLLKIDGQPRPAIFITGGAGKMSEEDKQLTRKIFEQGVAPFAQEHNIVVIDGATDSGVIEMMATARLKGRFTFPLIGIAPHNVVTYPGSEKQDGAALCPGHSHFVFVTGDSFGAESGMIIGTAHTLAGGTPGRAARTHSALGIVVNGGQITRQEAYMATTKDLNIPLIVMEGSGRFSDELSSAMRTGETSQALLRAIIQHGNIELIATTAGPGAMRTGLEQAFGAHK